MWWKINRQLIRLFSLVIALIFVSHGGRELIEMTLIQSSEYSVFRYMHASENVIIGLFCLLVECNSPLFRKNVNIMFRPTPKAILTLVFSIFLYTSSTDKLDFYLVFGMGFVQLILSFFTSKPRESHALI